MSFNLDVDISEALKTLNDLPKEVSKEVNKEIKATAFKIMAVAIKSISASPSQGVMYRRGGVTHQASKAGDAPNSDTGNLVQSISVIKKPSAFGLDEFLVGSPLNYAAWLEFGTLDMEARPWLEPAANKVEKDHVKRITTAVNEAINNAE